MLRDRVGPVCVMCKHRRLELFSVPLQDITEAVNWLQLRCHLSDRVASDLKALMQKATNDSRRKLGLKHHFRYALDPDALAALRRRKEQARAAYRARAAAKARAAARGIGAKLECLPMTCFGEGDGPADAHAQGENVPALHIQHLLKNTMVMLLARRTAAQPRLTTSDGPTTMRKFTRQHVLTSSTASVRLRPPCRVLLQVAWGRLLP